MKYQEKKVELNKSGRILEGIIEKKKWFEE